MTFRITREFPATRPGKRTGQSGAAKPAGRVPRIARLMALAIRFDRLVRDGTVEDYASLARLGHVTRARITQIINLLMLAPDIQEEILFLPSTVRGRDPIHLMQLQPIALLPNWSDQRRAWAALKARPTEASSGS
jgi:hypothetical protein